MAQKEKKYVVRNKSKSCLELRGKSGKRMPLLPNSEKTLTTPEYIEFQKSLAGFFRLVSVMQKGVNSKPAQEQKPQVQEPPKEPVVDPEAEGDLEIPTVETADSPKDEEKEAVQEEAEKEASQVKPVEEQKPQKQAKKTRRKKAKKKAKKKA